MQQFVFLFLILILGLCLPYVFHITEQFKGKKDGFSNFGLAYNAGNYPNAETDVLLQGVYPITGINGISNNTASNMWWNYPIFKLGSYAQITNNIRYPNSPDVGSCTPASMCGALYDKIKNKSNVVKPLAPLRPGCGTRIGYFITNKNMLPFRTDQQNILY
jgi:hypothetical protein